MSLSTPLSFTPAVGPKAGVSFVLPPLKEEYKLAIHANRLMNIQSESEMMQGVYLSSGGGITFPSYAEFQFTFILSYAVMLAYGVTANYAGLHTFHADLGQYLFAGGLGTLTETLPAGTTLGKGGAAVTARNCTAVVAGDYTPTYDVIPKSEITVTLLSPKARWTYVNGGSTVTTLPMM